MSTFRKVHQFLAWPTIAMADQLRRVPAMQRLNCWANEKERQWRRGRNTGLVAQLHTAGLHKAADELDEATGWR